MHHLREPSTSIAQIIPQPPPSFENITPQTILNETEDVINHTQALHDRLVDELTPTSATFANVIRPIVDDWNRSGSRTLIFTQHLRQASPSAEIRHAARQARGRIEAAQETNFIRHDVAALVSAVHARETSAPSRDLDAEDRHLLTYMHGQYVRSGASLRHDADRDKLRAAYAELNDICAAAENKLMEPEEGVWFERTELTGVPDAVLATMVEDGTRLQVEFRREHITAVMSFAVSNKTRRRLIVADWRRLPDNVKRLEKAVALRDEIARLLGFENHAALRVEDMMAPSIAFVTAQLQDLNKKLRPLAQIETSRLLELKKKDPSNDTSPVSELYEWDVLYYIREQEEHDSPVDQLRLAEYFETQHTLRAMLNVFHDLFGLDFLPAELSVWHETVKTYRVWDSPNEGGEFLGYLYVDLFERDGKYRGGHTGDITADFIEQNGVKHYPATAMYCSFPNATQSKPALLRHVEVKIMFHELGHAIHNLVSRTKYHLPRSHDYGEIPSRMLENWIWLPDVLIRIGKHYTTIHHGSNTDGRLPRDLAEAVCATRNSNRANGTLGSLWQALFDLTIHTPATHKAALDMDTTDIWNTTKQRMITTSCGDDPRQWGFGQARFIHMFRHYDAVYFSYLLCTAYAADLYAFAFAKDPMSVMAGRKWRYQVLEKGSSRPEMDILKEFLGRAPNTKALLDEIRAQMI